MKIDKAWDFDVNQTMQIQNKIYNVHTCIRLARDFPIIELSIDQMNISYSSPNANNNTIRSFIEHMKSTLEADLNFPIILNEDGFIIDGRHRLCKALFLEEKTIKAKRFIKDDETSFTWD